MFYQTLEGSEAALRARNLARSTIVMQAWSRLRPSNLLGVNVTPTTQDITQTEVFGIIKQYIDLRPLRAQDIFGSEDTYTWCKTMASAAKTTIVNNVQNISNRWYYINGVYNNEAIGELTELFIKRAGQDARDWPVEPLRNWEYKTGYADDPVIVEENQRITVQGYASSASTICDWNLLGEVAEKKGLTINP